MKNICFIIYRAYICCNQSQEISDAMRYSQDNLNGTARFKAMSGAFGH
jgi:predicted ester cyclase